MISFEKNIKVSRTDIEEKRRKRTILIRIRRKRGGEKEGTERGEREGEKAKV